MIDGISYLAVIVALLRMNVKARPPRVSERKIWHEMREGFRYSFHSGADSRDFVAAGAGQHFRLAVQCVDAGVRQEYLARQRGNLRLAAGGLRRRGAARRTVSGLASTVIGLGRVIAISCGVFAVSMIGFAFSTVLWLSMMLTFTASFGMMVQMAASNTILQTIVEDEMRARVMSFYTVDRVGNDPGRQLVVLGVGGRDRRSVYCGAWAAGCRLLGAIYFVLRLPQVANRRPADARKSRVSAAVGRRPPSGHATSRRSGVTAATALVCSVNRPPCRFGVCKSMDMPNRMCLNATDLRRIAYSSEIAANHENPMNQHDLIVIGSGPGGYTAAIRAAQLGLNVACIERESRLGGTCLRIGCIPSKALLESTHRLHEAQHSLAEHGIRAAGVEFDLSVMLRRKEQIVGMLTKGVDGLFKKNKVTRYLGQARLAGAGPSADRSGRRHQRNLRPAHSHRHRQQAGHAARHQVRWQPRRHQHRGAFL